MLSFAQDTKTLAVRGSGRGGGDGRGDVALWGGERLDETVENEVEAGAFRTSTNDDRS
jgi:hypothetical protein